MKILFLAPYPPGESPSQRYRFEHYLPYLSGQGITYAYKSFLSAKGWAIIFKRGNYIQKALAILLGFLKRWLLLFSVYRYDYIYIHREAAPLGPPVFEWIIAKIIRKKIIYDFDDAIWVPSASENNKIALRLKWFSKVKSICRWSYKVSAGNRFLADYAIQFNPNTIIIPTVVDTEKKHNQLQNHSEGKVTVGWTGTFSTLKYLDLVLPALQELQKKNSFTFIVIANKDPHLPLTDYKFIPWNKETEIKDLLTMHIGIMPLYNTDIEKGKCGFKAIQYMSLGIPAVVSPVGVNVEIVTNGIQGYVCDTMPEWQDSLELLLKNKTLRIEMGIAARKKTEDYFSVKATLELFLNIFKS